MSVPSINNHSTELQIDFCMSTGCNTQGEVVCHHCSQKYCYLCFMSHRKYLLDDMKSISAQMLFNRQQALIDVVSFIDKQAKDAHEQAKNLVNDAIQRIVKASENIHKYIETRRQAKLNRLEQCLEKFDQDASLLNSKLSQEILLPATKLLDLRRKYAYNMFDNVSSKLSQSESNLNQQNNERFFENYRYFTELMNLREKWTFFQGALTTVYYPAKKNISLDKILTFLEYRHDRIVNNYQEHLSKNNLVNDSSLKSTDHLLNYFSILSEKYTIENQIEHFSLIQDTQSNQSFLSDTSSTYEKNFTKIR